MRNIVAATLLILGVLSFALSAVTLVHELAFLGCGFALVGIALTEPGYDEYPTTDNEEI